MTSESFDGFIEKGDIEDKGCSVNKPGDYLDGGEDTIRDIFGFIGLLKQLKGRYMILNMMQVSSECRGLGIGRRLFEVGKDEARKNGARTNKKADYHFQQSTLLFGLRAVFYQIELSRVRVADIYASIHYGRNPTKALNNKWCFATPALPQFV